MALSAALLAMAFASSIASGRASRSSRAAIVAEGEARRALALVVAAWGPAMDSLPEGRSVEVAVAASPGRPPGVVIRAVVRRLASGTWLVASDVVVSQGVTGGAHRRLRLLLSRPPSPDSVFVAGPPAVIRQWAISEGW